MTECMTIFSPLPHWCLIVCSTAPIGRRSLRPDAANNRAPHRQPLSNLGRPTAGSIGARVGLEIAATDVFHWIYAVVHNPMYRQQFAAALRVDFPRIPWPLDTGEFQHTAALGKELAESHLCVSGAGIPQENAANDHFGTGEQTGAEWTSSLRASLADEVWQFRIGGYAVLPRWLRQRRQRILAPTDTDYLQRLIIAVQHTLAITERIEKVISPF